jgi:hypothetical protein
LSLNTPLAYSCNLAKSDSIFSTILVYTLPKSLLIISNNSVLVKSIIRLPLICLFKSNNNSPIVFLSEFTEA